MRRLLLVVLSLPPAVSRAQDQAPLYLDRNVTAGLMGASSDRNAIVLGNQMLSMLAQQRTWALMTQWAVAGEQKMARGQAGTSYQPSTSASIVATAPAGQREQMERALVAFGAMLEAKGLRRNDMADCRALAFTTSYYGLRGEDPGDQRLRNIRAEIRKSIVADPILQGLPEANKQAMCEGWAVSSVVAAASRDMARQAATSAEREAMIARAENAGAAVLRQLSGVPVEGLELTADGFGDRGARLAGTNRGGSTSFTRNPSHPAARAFDARKGLRAGTGQKLLERFLSMVRSRGGTDGDLADLYTTGLATLIQLRDQSPAPVSDEGWRRAREFGRDDFNRSPDWQRMPEATRQEFADNFGMEVALLVEQLEANERERAQAPPTDPIKRMLWKPPVSAAGAIAEQAGALFVRHFRADERPKLERLLRGQ